MELKLVAKVADRDLVAGEDVIAIIWNNGFLIRAINTKQGHSIIKVWTRDLQSVGETFAHEYPIYDMTLGEGSEFYTSCSDCVIHQWDNQMGSIVLSDILRGHREPPSKLRFDGNRLYSADSTGTVFMWENGECIGSLGTVEDIWDMLIKDDLLFTTRHLDVYMISIKLKEGVGVIWSIKNTLTGKGPLLISSQGDKLCLITRNTFEILVHDLKSGKNPLLGKLIGHEGVICSLVGGSEGDDKGAQEVIFSGGYDKTLIAWDLPGLKKIAQVKLEGVINDLAFDKQAGVVYVGSENRFLSAFKLV